MWRIFQAPLHFLKLIVKQKPLRKVNEIAFLCSYPLPHALAVFSDCISLLHLTIWTPGTGYKSILTIIFTNSSNSFHCKCFKTCHVPHRTAPFASIISRKNNLCCLFDSYGQQSNWCKLSIVQNPGFELSFPTQLLVILDRHNWGTCMLIVTLQGMCEELFVSLELEICPS